MHILHIYKNYYSESFGGVEQFIRQLGLRHVAAGHRVSVLTLSREVKEPTKLEVEGITVWRFPLTVELASNGFSFSAMKHFRALARMADVLHYHFPWPSGDVLHQLAPKRIPALATYHSDIVRQRFLKIAYAPLMWRFLGQMRAIVATSPNYIATSPVLKRYSAKTHAVPIGLDDAAYPAPANLPEWKMRVGEGFFLFVGVLRYYKGLDTAIDAALATGLPLVIAGEGPCEAELRARAGNASNIHFVGRVSDGDKMALLKLCRAFVFPSHLRSEAFGISLLEAAMAGKPMISCEIGTGTSFINRDGETGFVVPPQDVAAFASAMQTLSDDNVRAAQFGMNARGRFDSLFHADKMAADYLAIYNTLRSAA